MSQQIQKLEDELGQRLFDRMNRAVKLTPYGEMFLPRAVRILEEADVAKREASDAQHLWHGALTFGALPTIAPYVPPAALGEFTGKYPGVNTVVEEDTTARLLKLAHRYEIEFALASQPIHDDSPTKIRQGSGEENLPSKFL